ncbi:MAG: IclR family transcriptional regulator [Qingshengfaniella sp.]
MARRAGKEGGEHAYKINVLERAVSILKAFRAGEGDLSLKDLGSRTGLHASTCLRIVSVLRDQGLVAKDETTGRYRLGYELIALADIARSSGGIVALALPHMRELSRQFQETTAISVRSGDHRIDLEQVVGEQSVRRVIPLGVPKPLYAGAASRVLLSGLTDEELDGYLERVQLDKLATNTITDRVGLKESLAEIRRNGFAESVQEQFDDSGCGIVAPVFDGRGRLVAAVGVSVPQFRFSTELRDKLVPAVKHAAGRVSHLLGDR